jgi:ABC-type nitrate/sulfonate/bicarbonate transport system ATPase subunit
LFPWLTVGQNVEFGMKMKGLPKAERRDKTQHYLRLVHLGKFENSYIHQLSGGMAQRVGLARALVNHPRVLFLDEPLGALDAFTRMKMQDEVLRLWQNRGTTMLLVTHDIDEAIYMSDRIVLMSPRPGRVDRIIDVALPRPRQRNSNEFFQLRTRILDLLHLGATSEERNPYNSTAS